ncbi:hypothetical protein BT96DRAFT_944487 [Gymnopus androsaceus JB14]|uniref:Uncharacterized protein n=1 Tax=Gymnopus androsaceus JB14 TaxID=1447944 RepID=A0A6A4H4T3_9AGAR|nr:hypothetical protein BT96DRAFT_944487 [Gymnopus androsaceus JB14]
MNLSIRSDFQPNFSMEAFAKKSVIVVCCSCRAWPWTHSDNYCVLHSCRLAIELEDEASSLPSLHALSTDGIILPSALMAIGNVKSLTHVCLEKATSFLNKRREAPTCLRKEGADQGGEKRRGWIDREAEETLLDGGPMRTRSCKKKLKACSAKYPLAMVAKALKTFGVWWLLGYDIRCTFGITIENSSLGQEFKEKQCRTCQWDCEKYRNLTTMLHNNYVQALDIIENKLANETRHLQTLGSETEEDLHAATYVELLRKYRETNAAYENSGTNFCLHIPEDYQFLTKATSYNINLSETRKAETKRRFLSEQATKTLFEVVQMETVMGITCQWEPSNPEYTRAVEYVNTRKYHQALEHLHKLVVQHLFELHRMNLSNAAIQNAVKSYNTAALALKPPCDTLDWSKVSHYTFLDQFNILQDTWHSVFDQPWAKPINQTLMKQHHRIVHAWEEIVRCNIEIRRLHTSIINEGKHFNTVLQKLVDSPMLGPIADYINHCKAVNSLLLARIQQTHNLEGFTGNHTAGTWKGSSNDIVLQSPNDLHTNDPGSDNGEDVNDE